MSPPRILALCGSLRAGSFNRKLLNVAVAYARALQAEVDVLDLKVLALPFYDGDLEAEGLPSSVLELQRRLAQAQGLLIVSPEYNHSIPAALKNALDWASRLPPDLLESKWAVLMGTSSGPIATARMQPHLRQVLSSLGVYVLPGQVLVPRAMEAFADNGSLKESGRQKEVATLVSALVARLKS